MNNIQGYGLNKPSTRCVQAPGGTSSIQFGDNQLQPQQQPLGRKLVNGQNSNQQSQQDEQTKACVKVRNPPGGRSQITFG